MWLFTGGEIWHILFPLYLTCSFLQQETKKRFSFIQKTYEELPCVCFFSPDAKERTTKRFSAGGVVNFTTLHLSEEDKTLYIGAREILFALNLSDISQVSLQRNVRARNNLEEYDWPPNWISDVECWIIWLSIEWKVPLNITTVWLVLWFFPIVHMENSRQEERRVQFQRQRPAGE